MATLDPSEVTQIPATKWDVLDRNATHQVAGFMAAMAG